MLSSASWAPFLLILLQLVYCGDDKGAGGDEDHGQGEERHEPARCLRKNTKATFGIIRGE